MIIILFVFKLCGERPTNKIRHLVNYSAIRKHLTFLSNLLMISRVNFLYKGKISEKCYIIKSQNKKDYISESKALFKIKYCIKKIIFKILKNNM